MNKLDPITASKTIADFTQKATATLTVTYTSRYKKKMKKIIDGATLNSKEEVIAACTRLTEEFNQVIRYYNNDLDNIAFALQDIYKNWHPDQRTPAKIAERLAALKARRDAVFQTIDDGGAINDNTMMQMAGNTQEARDLKRGYMRAVIEQANANLAKEKANAILTKEQSDAMQEFVNAILDSDDMTIPSERAPVRRQSISRAGAARPPSVAANPPSVAANPPSVAANPPSVAAKPPSVAAKPPQPTLFSL